MDMSKLFKWVYDHIFGFTITEGGSFGETMTLLNEFPEPRNDFERAFFQYRGSVSYLTVSRRFIGNLVCLCTLVPLIVWVLIFSIVRHGGDPREKTPVVFFAAQHISVQLIPEEELGEISASEVPRVSTNFEPFRLRIDRKGWSLLLRSAASARFEPFFVAKVFVKLAQAGYIVSEYCPDKVVTNTESSFATSVLTNYFEICGVEYIGIMHGEFFANTKASFFRFSRFYAWDEYYKDLLIDQRCESTQLKLAAPPALKVPGYVSEREKIYDITYYCQIEDKQTMERLAWVIATLHAQGKKCCVRLHPLANREEYKRSFSEDVCLEAPGVTLGESLSCTNYVAGRCTTVLYQAYRLGKPIVIDDYSDPDEYKQLQIKNYRMLEVSHLLMSDLVNKAVSSD